MSRTAASRREFLSRVGQGMFVASVGSALALDLGLSTASGAESADRLTFGTLDPLVDLLQSTPADKLLPLVIGKLKAGTTLKEFVAAGALANARAFGGEDYIGFHTLMALGPALAMSQELPADRAALPVLKVLYRNSARIQDTGHGATDTFDKLTASTTDFPSGADVGTSLRDAVRQLDRKKAEQLFATSVALSPERGLNDLLPVLEDGTEVHRVVLMHRAWEMLPLVGREQAQTMLRQSLRYCLKQEPYTARAQGKLRELLPRVLEQFKLLDRSWGTRVADDKWVDDMVHTLLTSSAEHAAEAVASAIAEGVDPASIGEAISLTANQLVLRDPGRTLKQIQPGKPEGSVHGDSIGVHASDTANAWRNIASSANVRNGMAALVLAGYQVVLDRTQRGIDLQILQPRPLKEELAELSRLTAGSIGSQTTDAEILKQLDGAIRENNQSRACALATQYGQIDSSDRARPVFDILLKYATSEDGALHAEKYYRTVSTEFARTRPSRRWEHIASLARVTASEFGRKAAGMDQACELLSVT